MNQAIIGQYARFNVFQLVRLLQQKPGADAHDAWPVGLRLRFRADLRANFTGHEVTRLTRAKAMPAFRHEARVGHRMPARIELRTPNYCVASELGPLPEPFLEWVRDQERAGAHAMAAFLDAFNQRVHVLRHELKRRSLRALDPAQPERTRYAGQLAALMGVALPMQQAQIPLPMRAWLGLAGVLVNTRRSATVVAQVLTAYLGVPCRLQTMVGRWRDIEPNDRIALGRQRHALGQQSLLGSHTWDAHASVRLHVACMPYDAACALLPLRPMRIGDAQPDAAHEGLVALVRMLLDRRFDCDVELTLDSTTVPPSRMQLPWRGGGLGLRLGQTAWLGRHTGRRVRFTIDAFDAGAAA
ncbi:MAG: type VI secretion system baseplate subunit TssG [Lysobacter sp.]|nr:type VI secretion system baseplate subunit TssG [Lysobacter sp.]